MTREEIEKFFGAKVPKSWFVGSPTVDLDDEEILCVGVLPDNSAVEAFREATGAERVAIAQEAESRFGAKVSWGVQHEGGTTLFTTQTTPAMTRLRLTERATLDTLIEAGVARSRSEALAWCVRLVGRHEAEWLTDLRSALVDVERVRAEGPRARMTDLLAGSKSAEEEALDAYSAIVTSVAERVVLSVAALRVGRQGHEGAGAGSL